MSAPECLRFASGLLRGYRSLSEQGADVRSKRVKRSVVNGNFYQVIFTSFNTMTLSVTYWIR